MTDVDKLKKFFLGRGISHEDIELEYLKNGEHDPKDYKALKSRQRMWIRNNPNRKEHLIMHGGCLSCDTPLNQGIGVCLGCQYFDADWAKPDLSPRKRK